MIDFERVEIEKDYPHILSGQIYFNHASCAPMNRLVRTALEDLIRKKSKDEINDYPALVQVSTETKKLISEMINCSPERIAFVDNTTNGLNVLAQGIEWKNGDRIILNDAEFPSNVYPFLNLKRKGVEIDFVKSKNGIVTAEDILNEVTPGTRLISISQVQFLSGYRVNLAAIGSCCRENKIIFSVDGAQGLGAVTLDVENNYIDFISCGAQKWLLGLEGFAFIYVSQSLQNELNVSYAGWLSVKNAWELTNYNLEFRNSASRFQSGTINTFGAYALNSSLQLFKKYDFKKVENSVISNSRYFTDRLNQLGIHVVNNSPGLNHLSGIVSFKTQNGEKIINNLNAKNIICSLRENHIRFSPHFYNTKNEIDKVVDELGKIENLI